MFPSLGDFFTPIYSYAQSAWANFSVPIALVVGIPVGVVVVIIVIDLLKAGVRSISSTANGRKPRNLSERMRGFIGSPSVLTSRPNTRFGVPQNSNYNYVMKKGYPVGYFRR